MMRKMFEWSSRLSITVVFGLLLLPARRLGIVQMWAGIEVFTAGLLVLRGAH